MSPQERGGTSAEHAQVCVFAPSTIVTVTVEVGETDDEIHFHAGGQGFWIARLLGRLGVPTVLVTVVGGETGRVAEALVGMEPIELRAVESSGANGSWIHDRRSGDRASVAENPGQPLERHVVDDLYSAALASALAGGICVLAGPHRPGLVDPELYRRLSSDLRENDVTVIADLSGPCLESALEAGVDFCKTSDEDLEKTSGFDEDDDSSVHLTQLTERAAHAALTRGAEPLLASIDGRRFRVSSPSLESVDHRGAGDALTAMVAAARYWGMDWHDAVRWGAAAGSMAVVRRGLATPDRRDIHQLLDRVAFEPLD